MSHFRVKTASHFWLAQSFLDILAREHEFRDIIRIPVDEQSVSRSELIMQTIEDQELRFGPWTSFRDETSIYFIFRASEAAVLFRLLLT